MVENNKTRENMYTPEQVRNLITRIEEFGDPHIRGQSEKMRWYDELQKMYPTRTRMSLMQKVYFLRMKMNETSKTRFGRWHAEEKAYANRLIQVLPPTSTLPHHKS
jgi:hypothetical protein